MRRQKITYGQWQSGTWDLFGGHWDRRIFGPKAEESTLDGQHHRGQSSVGRASRWFRCRGQHRHIQRRGGKGGDGRSLRSSTEASRGNEHESVFGGKAPVRLTNCPAQPLVARESSEAPSPKSLFGPSIDPPVCRGVDPTHFPFSFTSLFPFMCCGVDPTQNILRIPSIYSQTPVPGRGGHRIRASAESNQAVDSLTSSPRSRLHYSALRIWAKSTGRTTMQCGHPLHRRGQPRRYARSQTKDLARRPSCLRSLVRWCRRAHRPCQRGSQ